MSFKKLILFFLILNFYFSQSIDEIYLNKGINELYNYNFESSLLYLDSTIILNPQNPVPYFVRIANKWLSTQINIGYDSSYQVIYEEVDKVIPIYENLISENPDFADNYLYLGSSYGLKARVDLAKKDWLSVIWSGYKGLDNIKYAQKLNPKLYDVFMPLGLMEYFSSISPKPIQWAANFVGIRPNRNIGLDHLKVAGEKSKYSWIEAQTILIYSYLYFENELILAREISHKMYGKFPGHPYFLYLYAESLLRTNKLRQFENLIPEIKLKPTHFPGIQKNECELKLNYLLALYTFKISEYETSLSYCNWIIENYNMEMDWLLGYTYLLMGKIFDLSSDREKAKIFYNKILEMDNLFIYDKWAIAYLNNPYKHPENDPLFIQK